MVEWWVSGGMGMYAVLVTALLLVSFSCLALMLGISGWFIRPLRTIARIAAVLAVLACILPMMVGALFGVYARLQVDQALTSPDIDPEQREAIARAGYQEARTPTMFGGGSTCMLLLPAGLAAAVGLAIRAPHLHRTIASVAGRRRRPPLPRRRHRLHRPAALRRVRRRAVAQGHQGRRRLRRRVQPVLRRRHGRRASAGGRPGVNRARAKDGGSTTIVFRGGTLFVGADHTEAWVEGGGGPRTALEVLDSVPSDFDDYAFTCR